jgi:chemosensory pili system protein ChpA (sensor histidine kinase/response regulator)
MMLPATEREIRIQFLETATEYLNKLEAILSEINTEPQDIPERINAVLRILHSLKGSAGMLELRMLSDLAHRLEDAFHVLKNRRDNLEIDPDLHNLLLSAVDWLRHILELIAADYLVDEHWLATFCYPLFEELYQRLGKPELAEISVTLAQMNNSENIIHLVFKTEVEKNLQSLERLLDNGDAPKESRNLLQATAIATANELAGLGDILNIPVFAQLCESIKQLLVVNQSQRSLIHITSLALKLWRRSQSLILANKIEELPSVIRQLGDGEKMNFSHNSLDKINIPHQQLWSLPDIAINQGESTVKVPMQQIESLNNLCGQLNIHRHSLQNHLVKLHGLTRNLSHNTQYLQQKQISFHNSSEQIINAIIVEPGDEYQQLNIISQVMRDTIVKFEEILREIQDSLDNTDTVNYLLKNTTQQLQNSIHQVMMRPLSDLVNPFPKVLQDLSIEYGKNVQLRVEGANILVERSIFPTLTDTLMHLLHNAFDHGIETPEIRHNCGKSEQGLITIQASQQNNYMTIKMSDDGQGISLEKIRSRAMVANASDAELLSLIFEPGFTTCEQVTVLSGRGMGMDIVCNNLKQIQGEIRVDTEVGRGTTFTILIPVGSRE